jgi:hypothetical protein
MALVPRGVMSNPVKSAMMAADGNHARGFSPNSAIQHYREALRCVANLLTGESNPFHGDVWEDVLMAE